MATIHDIPFEILEQIFELGGEEHPGDWFNLPNPTDPDCFSPNLPVGMRTVHPFIQRAGLVCATWHGIAGRVLDCYYTYLEYFTPDWDIEYISSQFRKYRNGLQQSRG